MPSVVNTLKKDRWYRDLSAVVRQHCKCEPEHRVKFGSHELRGFLRWAQEVAAGRPAPHIEQLAAEVFELGVGFYGGIEVQLAYLRGCHDELRGFGCAPEKGVAHA